MSTAPILSANVTPSYTTPLLDSITVQHGPRDLLGRFFLAADQAARDAGVDLQLNTDLSSLIQTNSAWADVWGTPIVPIFDPADSVLSAANSFWISGHDRRGKVVATQAARFLDLTGTTLSEAMTSLRLFYADPAPQRAGGARCQVECPSAQAITGRVVYSGGGWFHPDYRGRGLSRILPRISRNLAYTRWESDMTVSMVKTALIEKGVHRSYGYTRQEPRIRLTGAHRDDIDFHLVWMDTEEMLADTAAYTATT